MYLFITLGLLALGFFGTIAALITRYKRCPSDKLLVIYGKTNGGTANVYHGGGAFVWPVIQDYAFLDLKPMAIEVDLKGALSKQNIRLDVPSTFTIGISTEKSIMQNAAERLLGMDARGIHTLAKDIILGQLRLVIATMDIEEINSNREKLLSAVQENVETELHKIGLKLINVNITDIQDESGYIKALGQEAAAKALNDAKTSVAQKNRDGAIGSTEAHKEQRIKTSELNASAQIGEADAETRTQIGLAEARTRSQIGSTQAITEQRTKTAELESNAVEGENKAAINIANTTSERRVAEAEAERKAVTAKNIADAKAKEDSYKAEQMAESARAERERSSLIADQLVPAEIAKNKLIIEADAKSEQIRRIAQGEADAVFLAKEAEAKGIKEILEKQAEGFERLVQSAGGNPDKAIQLMIADKLPELMRIQVDAIKNIKIDKITVWDSMGGGNGSGSTTAGFLNGMLGALPAYDELYRMTGKELPKLLNLGNVEETTTQDSSDDDIEMIKS
jgi:flotillin